MSRPTKKLAYFPSLYDPSPASEDIWTMMLSRNVRTDPKTNVDEEAWPKTGRLAVAKYQPLDFYCPPIGPAVFWSEGDHLCELGIRLKEMELVTLMEEALTSDYIVSPCHFKARQH